MYAYPLISPDGRFRILIQKQCMNILLFLVSPLELVSAHTVQLNMNILVDTDQVQFSVFLLNPYLAGKVGSRISIKFFRCQVNLLHTLGMRRLLAMKNCRKRIPQAVLVKLFLQSCFVRFSSLLFESEEDIFLTAAQTD